MELEEMTHPQNEVMEVVWLAAYGNTKIKKKQTRLYHLAMNSKISEICNALLQAMERRGHRLYGRLYYRSSMMANGLLMLYEFQVTVLLETVDLMLKNMRREKRMMEDFHRDIDVKQSRGKHLRHHPYSTDQFDFDTSPHIQRSAAPTDRMGMNGELSRSGIDQDYDVDFTIDWSNGPARARVQDITVLDLEVPFSPQYLDEVRRLSELEGDFGGPSLADFPDFAVAVAEAEGREQQAGVSTTQQVMEGEQPEVQPTEPPAATSESPVTPTVPPAMPEERTTLPEVVTEAPMEVEEVVQPAEPLSEGPSQIELPPLPREYTKPRRVRKLRKPVTDPVIELSKEVIRFQLNTGSDTMRHSKPSDDIFNPASLLLKRFEFLPGPARPGPLARSLMDMFDNRMATAPLPDPPHLLPDIGRRETMSDTVDISALTTLLPDSTLGTSSLPSKSISLEAPTAMLEDTVAPLQPIEEGDAAPAATSHPGPIGLSPERRSSSPKPKRKKPRSDSFDGGFVQGETQVEVHHPRTSPPPRSPPAGVVGPSTPLATAGLTSPAAVVGPSPPPPTAGPSPPPTTAGPSPPPAVMSPLKRSMVTEETKALILEYLGKTPTVSFLDLLPSDPTDKEASHLFSVLLGLHNEHSVRLLQDQEFGTITVTLPHPQQVHVAS